MSETNRTRLSYVAESTYGTTPADSANWKTFRTVSDSITETPQAITSNEIRNDRMVSSQIIAGTEVSGDIAGYLSEDTWDDWLEAALGGTWATNALKAGTTKRSFTVERWYGDIDKYISFTGCYPATMNLSARYGDYAMATFGVRGKASAVADTSESLVGSGTLAAATTTQPMAAIDVSSIKIGGSEATANVSEFSISLDNNLRAITDIRTRGANEWGWGFSKLTGSISIYFDDHDLYEGMLANTVFDLDVTITLGAKSYRFDMPNCRIQSGAPTPGGVNQDIIVPYGFEVFYDSGTSTHITITRAT